MTMILLNSDQAAGIRSQSTGSARLDPVHVGQGVYILPLAALTDLAHATQHEALSALPTGDPLAAVKAKLLEQLAAIRWGKCQLFAYDGEAAAYADAAIAVTTAKIRALEESGSTDPVNFKLTATAWRSWTLTQLKAYGQAIDAHIQACFDNEAAIAAQINTASDFDALNAIDLEAGWP